MIAHGRGSGIIDPAGGQNPLADTDYEHILRNDLASFTIRTFYELHPHGPFLHAPFIDLMVSRLVACLKGDSEAPDYHPAAAAPEIALRQCRLRRLAVGPSPLQTRDLRELWPRAR